MNALPLEGFQRAIRATHDAEAVRWLRKAAAQGDDYAQHNLGVMYSFGRGVAQDDAEAVRWYRKAAEQGNADAMRALARGMLEDAMKAKPKGAK